MGDLTTNFSIAEFNCHDGTRVPATLYSNVKLLAENLQVLRDFVGGPIRITSGYRSSSHNRRVGGKKYSEHLNARAADFTIAGVTPREIASAIEALIRDGKMLQGGVGLYSRWVHYDVRGTRARW